MRKLLAVLTIAGTMAITAPAAADEPPAPAPSETSPPTANAEAAEAPKAPPPRAQVGTQKLVGAVVGAAGFLTTAIGGFLVISGLNLHTEASGRCESRGCSQDDVKDGDLARSRANVGGVVFVSGLALLGGGFALWFTAPKSKTSEPAKEPKAQVGFAPTLGGLSAVGTF